jgi:cytoplasmic tRNA 2-thiolation protein 2
MVCLLDEQTRIQAGRKASSPFEVLAVHVDTDLDTPQEEEAGDTPAQRLLARYRDAFPRVEFLCVPLSKVLQVRTVDWSTLPSLGDAGQPPAERLRSMFARLPSVTAKADVLRMLIRHLLLHIAMERSYAALLLGHSTTALAALTLAEVANGRGFSVPWQVNDGRHTLCTYDSDGAAPTTQTEYPIHYPMREVFGGEISTYISLVPALTELRLRGQGETEEARRDTVVSHKDTSIEEVMARYFESVEDSFSGIVANVVRTTGKLDRVRGDTLCGLCGVTLDQQGDDRWAGEIGLEPDEGDEQGVHHPGKLCYGCKRSVHG